MMVSVKGRQSCVCFVFNVCFEIIILHINQYVRFLAYNIFLPLELITALQSPSTYRA